MIYVRMAESADSVPFSFVCSSICEGIALAHTYVGYNDKRIADVINTDIPWPYDCGIVYTKTLSFSDGIPNDATFCRLFNTTL